MCPVARRRARFASCRARFTLGYSLYHPSSQGFVQALGVFIDTILICTATGVMILMSDALQPGSGVTSTVLRDRKSVV